MRKRTTCPRRKPLAERQLAKVLVEGDDDAPLSLGPCQHLAIPAARRVLADPRHVVAVLPKRRDRGAGNILVGEQADAHRLPGDEGIDLFRLHKRARVFQTGVHILLCQSRIVREQVFLRPPLRQQV